jgi:hypothetical protein
MAYVNHVNYPNGSNQIYCRKRKKVVELTDQHQTDYCDKCQFFNGSAQGEGVECRWDDPRNVPDLKIVTDPQLELNQLLIADSQTTKERLIVDK